MSTITIIISLITIVLGLLFLFFPDKLMKFANSANRIILTDRIFLEHNRITGISLLITGIYMLTVFFRY